MKHANRQYDLQLTPFERRLSRLLDEEMDGPEQAEFYRQILRDPSAHEEVSLMQAIDGRCRDALREGLELSGSAGKARAGTGASALRLPRRRAGRNLRFGAIAAAVLAFVGGVLILDQLRQSSPEVGTSEQLTRDGRTGSDSSASSRGSGFPVDEALPVSEPVRPDRVVGDSMPGIAQPAVAGSRDFVGIVDPSGSMIFFIEVEGSPEQSAAMDF
ncbi:MAG: hypothetical protein JJU36_03805 [Phycisphaeraceae bacterium]|nr:hypothetical protein [Phycisphaeraceae bacterium]